MCESWNNCLAWSLGDKVLEQTMALMELKKAVINHETSTAPTHWARFGDCRNQLVAKYIGNVVYIVVLIQTAIAILANLLWIFKDYLVP